MEQNNPASNKSFKEKIKDATSVLSWALYDLANQFFALNVISLYFVRWVTLEKKSPEIFYSIAFGISMFFVAILAPILGTISDIRGKRKVFLIYFTFQCFHDAFKFPTKFALGTYFLCDCQSWMSDSSGVLQCPFSKCKP